LEAIVSDMTSFNVTYDRDSDVLYISTRKSPAARGVEDRYGIVWRYDGQGDLIGATVVDFYGSWHTKRPELAYEIARNFQIPEKQARVVVDHAFNS
jgi:hypothetical protein